MGQLLHSSATTAAAVLSSDTTARTLRKAFKGFTPYEFICRAWINEPQ